MSLPDLIEIVPLDKHVKAEITVPGSKSITNRALILAALADGETVLKGALWSEDTQVMVEALLTLGFDVKVEDDPEEFCNRTITVWGFGGRIPREGTAEQPVEIFVGNAGTAARFLAAMVCLGNGVYRLHGVPRMHERPQAALFKALRELGYRVESENDRLPAIVFGSSRGNEAPSEKAKTHQSLLTSAATSKVSRSCTVSIEESSQFASALLLCAKVGGWEIKVTGENAEESPYVAMTIKLIEAFPKAGGSFRIEPDASSGSYFWGAAWLFVISEGASAAAKAIKEQSVDLRNKKQKHLNVPAYEASDITVSNWPTSGWQIDADLTKLIAGWEPRLKKQAHRVFVALPLEISRKHDLGDSIMTLVCLAPFGSHSASFTDLGRLRLQETERVVALQMELTKCGAKVVEEGDNLTVYPSKLHGAVIETYNDHRMAMCFAILGLKVPGIKIQNPACVKKTFPNFFQKLAAPPPNGLGATILDGKTGRKLEMDELFAD